MQEENPDMSHKEKNAASKNKQTENKKKKKPFQLSEMTPVTHSSIIKSNSEGFGELLVVLGLR